ncbi:hypothetical protein ACI2OX_02105 [Bacillus sp. N9]
MVACSGKHSTESKSGDSAQGVKEFVTESHADYAVRASEETEVTVAPDIQTDEEKASTSTERMIIHRAYIQMKVKKLDQTQQAFEKSFMNMEDTSLSQMCIERVIKR